MVKSAYSHIGVLIDFNQDAFKKELRLCRDTKLVDGLSEDGNLILQFDKKAEAWRTIANLFVIGELLQREGDHCFPSFAGSQMAGFNQQVFKKLVGTLMWNKENQLKTTTSGKPSRGRRVGQGWSKLPSTVGKRRRLLHEKAPAEKQG